MHYNYSLGVERSVRVQQCRLLTAKPQGCVCKCMGVRERERKGATAGGLQSGSGGLNFD